MIKEQVVQKTTFTCDKCKSFKVVETELEECYGQYDKISEDTPDGFHEIEELHMILCDKCYKELKSWMNN
jgi:hypothetical protein